MAHLLVAQENVKAIGASSVWLGVYHSVHKFLFGGGKPAISDRKICCRKLLEKVDDWDLDIFALADVANGKQLAQVVSSIFQKRAIAAEFSISKLKLDNFLNCLEDQYDDKIPYHNSSHAADVTHCVHVLLNSSAFDGTFSKLEVFAALFAAAVHDAGHPGWSNGFLAKISFEVKGKEEESSGGARRENRPYLEERHLLTAFCILEGVDCNILCGLDVLQSEYFKRLVTDMVLATDMARHADLMTRVRSIVQHQNCCKIRLETYDEKIAVLQFVLHSANLSNATKRFQTYERFVNCLSKERYQMGDQEKMLGLPVSPCCDRHNVNVPTQASYITSIVEPLWKLWHELVMDEGSEAILKSLKSNLNEWQLNQR